MSLVPELWDDDLLQENEEKTLLKDTNTEKSNNDDKNNNTACDTEKISVHDISTSETHKHDFQDSNKTGKSVDLIKVPEVTNTDANGNENEPLNVQSESPRAEEVVILSSFSKSGSASNTEPGFFQPNPKNFFDNWPTPFYYLPAHKQDTSRGFNLVKFITAGLSQRRQRRWTQSLRRQAVSGTQKQSSDSHPCIQFLEKVTSSLAGPSNKAELPGSIAVSKPNSSLLQLTGVGNRELGEFLTRMEEVRGHLNNATCTLLQSTILLMLPHLKLLSGHQLDSTSCQTFVEEWIQIVVQMAKELQPESTNEAEIMISREFQSLRRTAKRLYKRMKKLNRKIQRIFDHNDAVCKKALVLLHPKSAISYKGRFSESNGQEEKLLQSETVKFAPIPLHQANISTVELFQNHIIFSLSKTNNLLYKTEIDGDWSNFSDLSYGSRRDIFLSVVDDLQWTLNSPSTNQIELLCKKGYPESIRSKIKENIEYLKKAGKQNDLLVLSKVTIVTQVNCLHDSTTRLLRSLRDAMGISKYFYKAIKINTYRPIKKRKVTIRKRITAVTNQRNSSEVSRRENISLCDNLMTLPLIFDKSKAKLVVPFPISTDPIEDQFFMSSV
ncbi:unnamed protein product [Orchesella dallaii]|uniref:Uncharacterized protein n=1 Tax=Orchesella dallaii TaxID=48710 RepID=A0ABP1QJE4_9HEXA